MAAIISINSGTGGVSNDSITLGSTVSLYSVDAATTYQWAIVSQPAGPTDALVTPTQRAASFTASKEGSYLLRLVVDDGLPTEDSQQLIAAVRELETGDRVPAVGETTENSANDGWANPVDAILRRVTQFTEAGVQPGVAAEALVVGDVVYAGDVYTLAAGLPGERVVASWSKAHADVAAEVQGVFGVVASSVDGGSIAADDVITVQTTGLYQGVPFGSAPSVGDSVYISDAAGLSLTQGTIKRQIGTVCAVGMSTFDVMVGPAPAELAVPDLFAKTYFVATSGSDVTGDGSITNPFATPQKAHDVALVDYPTDWVSVEIGPGSYVGSLLIEKWNIVFHGAGSRPETQATKILGAVTVTPDAATQKFNEVVGLDRLYVEPPSASDAAALRVEGSGAFSVVVTDCYLTTANASAVASVVIEPSNAIRPRVTFNDCIITVQTAGPDIVAIGKGDVRMSNAQLLFGSGVSSGSVGKGITVASDASLFADRLLLDIQTLGPAIEVTGSLAGTKLTLSNSAITLSNASCSHAISATNSSAGQLVVFAWNCVFGIANAASKIINGTGSLGTNIVMVGQISSLFGTVGGLGSTVTRLDMSPGVLAYTNASYPAPSGLAPISSTIPVGGTAGATTTFQVDGSTGGTQAPSLSLRAGANGGGGAGGDATLKAGNSTTGAGGTVFISAGDGDNAGGVAQMFGGDSSAGEGGTIAAGAADFATGGGATIIGGTGPIGGAIAMTAGQGDTTDGGAASLTAGVGAVDGGLVSVIGGAAGTGDGGSVAIEGGASTGERGGNVSIVGGDSTGSGAAPDGGNVEIDGGTGNTNGVVRLGATDAEYVALGRTDKDVIVNGRNVETAVTYAPVATTTIPVTGPTIILAATAPRTMTATPNIQTSGITAGTRVTFIGGANAVTFQRESALAGSELRMTNPTQTVDLYDVITFVYDGSFWREASFMSNS